MGLFLTPLIPIACGLEEYVIDEEDVDGGEVSGDAGEAEAGVDSGSSESDEDGDGDGDGDGDESDSDEDGDTGETGDSPAQEPELSPRDALPRPRPPHAPR